MNEDNLVFGLLATLFVLCLIVGINWSIYLYNFLNTIYPLDVWLYIFVVFIVFIIKIILPILNEKE